MASASQYHKMRKPNFIDNLPSDKVLHFAIGSVCFSFLSLFNLILAIVGTLILGIAIEIYQKITNSGHFELLDAIAVWLGGCVVLLPILFIK